MIYCVISDTKNRENSLNKKGGCPILRQSPTAEVLDYISRAKNEDVRAERLCAYTTLLSALSHFLGIRNPVILRQEGKKPVITSHDVYFNISHCNGIVAVTISNDVEVGVDIQSTIEEKKQIKLEKRFLSGLLPCPEKIEIGFYFMEGDTIYEVDLPLATGEKFEDRWSAMESLMKLSGDGFSALSNIEDIAEKSITDIRNIKLANTEYSITNSIKMVKM